MLIYRRRPSAALVPEVMTLAAKCKLRDDLYIEYIKSRDTCTILYSLDIITQQLLLRSWCSRHGMLVPKASKAAKPF
jgi:hypothetical protein